MANGPILIITPTLAESEFLDATVQSVLEQKFPFIHMLAVPAAKVSTVQQRYPHAIVVPDAGRRGGIYGAINAALDAAPRDWTWFTYINDDDRLTGALSEVVQAHLTRPEPEPVAYGEVDLINETSAVIAGITIERGPRWIPGLLQSGISPLMQQGTLFERGLVEKIGRFDLRYRLCADLDFWLRAYASGAKFRHYPNRLAQFRIRAGQLSADTTKTAAEQAEIVARHLPARIAGWKRLYGVARFRVFNLSKYWSRLFRFGWRSSYQILGGNQPTRAVGN